MQWLKRFLRDRAGNFGLLTAVGLIPLVGSAGFALDYSYCYSVHAKLQAAADAAVLGAISERSPGFIAASSMQADGEIAIAEDDGEKLFRAQGNLATITFPIDIDMNVAKHGGNLTATANFTASVPTTFLQLFGKSSVAISGQATAVYEPETPSTYADFYMLLDNTPSMGIGATQADIDALVAATANSADGAGRKCAFACHMVWSNSGVENQDSDYIIARNIGVTLRIDVVRKAVQALIADASTLQGSTNLFRFAAYSFGPYALEPGYRIGKLSGLTDDLSSVRNAAGNLDLETTDHHNYNQDALTSFDTALTNIGKEIPTDGGSGSSSSDRQKIVYFITDGVGDSIKKSGCTGLYSGSDNRCLEPIDVSYCTALKNRNIKIAVLYTTYIPVNDHMWDAYVGKFSSQIGPKLQECASPDLYAEVGPNDDMTVIMKRLFNKAATASRIRLSS